MKTKLLNRCVAAALLGGLGGCGYFEDARLYAVDALVPLVVAECYLSKPARAANLAAFNAALAAKGHKIEMPAIDCDGQGGPDDLGVK